MVFTIYFNNQLTFYGNKINYIITNYVLMSEFDTKVIASYHFPHCHFSSGGIFSHMLCMFF